MISETTDSSYRWTQMKLIIPDMYIYIYISSCYRKRCFFKAFILDTPSWLLWTRTLRVRDGDLMWVTGGIWCGPFWRSNRPVHRPVPPSLPFPRFPRPPRWNRTAMSFNGLEAPSNWINGLCFWVSKCEYSICVYMCIIMYYIYTCIYIYIYMYVYIYIYIYVVHV